MTVDERNFRSSYYEKVGCHSVEEKKSLNKLLQDNVRNHSKLKQFCLTYTVPSTHRSLLWNILLGVMPLHKNSTEYVVEQRKAAYNDLLSAVTIMQFVNSSTPKYKVFLSMWQLEQNRLLYPNDLYNEIDHAFIEIVKVLSQVFESDVETYWLAKEFYMQSRIIEQECDKLKELTQTLLKKEDLQLYNHLNNLKVFKYKELLDRWYVNCFAGVISDCTIVRVWDKICGGSRKILIFVFLELVNTLKDSILKCNTWQEFKTLIEQMKDQDAITGNKAIKNWQNNKKHSEIIIH